MSKSDLNLHRFALRVRLLRAWLGFAIGGAVGALLALLWSAMDYFRISYTEWPYLVALAGGGALVGAIAGACLGVRERDLARSIDMRGALEDRISTGVASFDETSSFYNAQRLDAEEHLRKVRPGKVYPLRLSRWHGAFMLAGIIAAAFFILGNSPLLLNKEQRADREKLQQQAAEVERVAKPVLDKPDKSPQEKVLANQLEEYRDELKKARMSVPESMQKANDLSKQADDLAKSSYQQSRQDMDSAQSDLDKMEAQALQAQGMNVDPSLLRQLSQSPIPPSREQELQDAIKKIQDQLKSGKDANGHVLSEAKGRELTKEMEELEKELAQLHLSQKVLDMLKRLQSQPEFKKLIQMMEEMEKQLQKNAPSQSGSQPLPTKEQLEQMMKQLEALADQLKTDKDMEEYLKRLEEALKHMQSGNMMASICFGLFNLPHMGSPGPGNGTERYFANTHQIPLAKNPATVKAKADPLAVHGDRAEQGTETYIEIKGPTGMGAKSHVPYSQVFKQYRREAEQALDRQAIPPDQQKRVKDYFDSLEEGG